MASCDHDLSQPSEASGGGIVDCMRASNVASFALGAAAAGLVGWVLHTRAVASAGVPRNAAAASADAADDDADDDDDAPLWDLWLSSFSLPAATASLELGVFGALAEGTKSAAELAERINGLGPRGATMLLRAIAGLGLAAAVADNDDGSTPQRWTLTPLARRHVVADASTGSSLSCWNPMLLAHRGEVHQRLLSHLRMDEANTGPMQAWEQPNGIDLAVARSIVTTMHAHSASTAARLATMLAAAAWKSPHFNPGRTLLDVGGCSGVFAIELAKSFPALHCTIVELDEIVPIAKEFVEQQLKQHHQQQQQLQPRTGDGGGGGALAERIKVVEGSFFESPSSWPRAPHSPLPSSPSLPAADKSWDSVLLSNILHDWPTATNAMILRSCFEVLRPGAHMMNDCNPIIIVVSSYFDFIFIFILVLE